MIVLGLLILDQQDARSDAAHLGRVKTRVMRTTVGGRMLLLDARHGEGVLLLGARTLRRAVDDLDRGLLQAGGQDLFVRQLPKVTTGDHEGTGHHAIAIALGGNEAHEVPYHVSTDLGNEPRTAIEGTQDVELASGGVFYKGDRGQLFSLVVRRDVVLLNDEAIGERGPIDGIHHATVRDPYARHVHSVANGLQVGQLAALGDARGLLTGLPQGVLARDLGARSVLARVASVHLFYHDVEQEGGFDGYFG